MRVRPPPVKQKLFISGQGCRSRTGSGRYECRRSTAVSHPPEPVLLKCALRSLAREMNTAAMDQVTSSMTTAHERARVWMAELAPPQSGG
jgi:hypothetical protein